MAAVSSIETPATEELREFYDRVERSSRGIGVLNVFKVMAHSPELMEAWWRMMVVALSRLQLDARLRELAILRLFQLTRSAYGFAHHVRIGKDASLTDDDIAALGQYAPSPRFSELDKLVLRYTDAVTTLTPDAPALAGALREHLSERELVELTFCIANWNLMARLLAPLEIELEPAAQALLPEGWDGTHLPTRKTRVPDESDTLRPGVVSVFGPKGSLAVGIGVWAQKNDAGRVHIHMTGGDNFHTTVTNHAASKRYHRVLFRDLRRLLIEYGAWPYGDEGAETEDEEDE